MIHIYTDGSAAKNRSGWGWILVRPDGTYEIESGIDHEGGTNQRMELTAALQALAYWAEHYYDEDVTIHSDSAYFCNCYFEKWYIAWENNDYKTSRNEPVMHQDLWRNLIGFFKNPRVHIEKVKGHSGHTYNEIADELASGVFEMKNLTRNELNDKIDIELSEVLLDYVMKKYPVGETIKRIRKVCNCE